MVAILLMSAVSLAGVTEGRSVYAGNCQACHGAAADGKGAAATSLVPAPTDFTDPAWWKGRDDDSLKGMIRSGKGGTSMMPFSQLSDQDIADLVAFLRTKAE